MQLFTDMVAPAVWFQIELCVCMCARPLCVNVCLHVQGQEDVARLERSRDELLATIGNIVDDSVPVSNDEVRYSPFGCAST